LLHLVQTTPHQLIREHRITKIAQVTVEMTKARAQSSKRAALFTVADVEASLVDEVLTPLCMMFTRVSGYCFEFRRQVLTFCLVQGRDSFTWQEFGAAFVKRHDAPTGNHFQGGAKDVMAKADSYYFETGCQNYGIYTYDFMTIINKDPAYGHDGHRPAVTVWGRDENWMREHQFLFGSSTNMNPCSLFIGMTFGEIQKHHPGVAAALFTPRNGAKRPALHCQQPFNTQSLKK
jgi:hypothetical protein